MRADPSALTVHFRTSANPRAHHHGGFFAPDIYPYKGMTEVGRRVLLATRCSHLTITYRTSSSSRARGHWKWLFALGGASVMFFLLAYWVFDRLRDTFAEEV